MHTRENFLIRESLLTKIRRNFHQHKIKGLYILKIFFIIQTFLIFFAFFVKMFYFVIITIFLLDSTNRINSVGINETICSCSVGDLERLEQLNFFNYRRLRIEHGDGLRKYTSSEITATTIVECKATVLYEKVSDSKLNKIDKRCRTCIFNETTSFWSELDSCGIIKCDKDILIGNPLLSAEYGRNPPFTQQLFEPGKITAIFKFGNSRRCKICQVNSFIFEESF